MKKIIASVSLSMFPFFAFADTDNVESLEDLGTLVKTILGKILPIIVSIAVIWFVYNVFAYMIAGDEDKKAAAKSNMIYGIIALFVMVSVWGLVAILTGTFGFTGNENSGDLPGFPKYNSSN